MVFRDKTGGLVIMGKDGGMWRKLPDRTGMIQVGRRLRTKE